MLTRRSAYLLAAALLPGFSAAAQSAPSGPQGTDILTWAVWWLASLVLLLVLVTGASLASGARRYVRQAQTSAPEAATAPASAPMAGPAAQPALPRPVVAAPVEYAAA
ncbi:hypothetical protein KLP40_17240 [Hymenobacter sp. NST-14]|uniref:hypothetical protein n=1 Tax=Hymenobacter piscis TaxID=2839984 RepID=UPI001C010264|nr:hypothetical protein [Hymenobacter piscis]MBT9394914.1 hypothetical protein [Hymenobacter piscis]